jgi:hypothetical protein
VAAAVAAAGVAAAPGPAAASSSDRRRHHEADHQVSNAIQFSPHLHVQHLCFDNDTRSSAVAAAADTAVDDNRLYGCHSTSLTVQTCALCVSCVCGVCALRMRAFCQSCATLHVCLWLTATLMGDAHAHGRNRALCVRTVVFWRRVCIWSRLAGYSLGARAPASAIADIDCRCLQKLYGTQFTT